jgi:hypothetical protein
LKFAVARFLLLLLDCTGKTPAVNGNGHYHQSTNPSNKGLMDAILFQEQNFSRLLVSGPAGSLFVPNLVLHLLI